MTHNFDTTFSVKTQRSKNPGIVYFGAATVMPTRIINTNTVELPTEKCSTVSAIF